VKIFLVYRFTGENIVELEKTCDSIVSALEKSGHKCFCSLSREEHYQKNKLTRKQIYFDAMKEIDSCDAVLLFVKSDEKSEGMLVEAGYALAKGKKIILTLKNGVHAELLGYISDEIIEFDTIEELCEKLSKLKHN